MNKLLIVLFLGCAIQPGYSFGAIVEKITESKHSQDLITLPSGLKVVFAHVLRLEHTHNGYFVILTDNSTHRVSRDDFYALQTELDRRDSNE